MDSFPRKQCLPASTWKVCKHLLHLLENLPKFRQNSPKSGKIRKISQPNTKLIDR